MIILYYILTPDPIYMYMYFPAPYTLAGYVNAQLCTYTYSLYMCMSYILYVVQKDHLSLPIARGSPLNTYLTITTRHT